MQPVNKEVLTATDATISCIISGITQKLDAVVWRKDGTDVTSLSGSNYVVSAGTYGSNSQTTTLTVKAAANTADLTYTCVITSNEHQETNKATSVKLNVFCKFFRSLLRHTTTKLNCISFFFLLSFGNISVPFLLY